MTPGEPQFSPSLQRAIVKDHGALEGEARRYKAQRDDLLKAIAEHRETLGRCISPIDEAVYEAADRIEEGEDG